MLPSPDVIGLVAGGLASIFWLESVVGLAQNGLKNWEGGLLNAR